MDQKLNPIQPPPSVDDLLSLGPDARLGQVDFANRLVPATDPAATTDAGRASVTSVLPRRRPVTAVPEPVVETETVAEVAADPEVVVQPEPVVQEPVVEAEPAPAPAPPAKPAPKSRPKPATKAKPAPKAKSADAAKRNPTPSPEVAEPQRAAAPAAPVVDPVIPAILPIANLSGDAVSASAAYDDEFFDHHQVEQAERVGATAAPTLRVSMQPVAPQPQARIRTAAPAPSPAAVVEESAYVGGTVQEIADSAIERLRDAENATLAHLAALEAEAARRAELLTAQAELDAELIRITARREAHAIISAARSQAGLGAPSTRDSRQLAEISDAVSRFAESIESTLAPTYPYPSQGDQA